MSEAIGQPGQAALPRPLGIGEILSMAFQLYRRHWGTLLPPPPHLHARGAKEPGADGTVIVPRPRCQSNLAGRASPL